MDLYYYPLFVNLCCTRATKLSEEFAVCLISMVAVLGLVVVEVLEVINDDLDCSNCSCRRLYLQLQLLQS